MNNLQVVNILNDEYLINKMVKEIKTIEECENMLKDIELEIEKLEIEIEPNDNNSDDNKLQIKGTTNFMGIEIPNVYGGFGEGKKAITDKHIAEIHNKEVKHIRELIKNNIKRFKEDVDYIDLLKDENFKVVVNDLGLKGSNRTKNIYLLSERGYAKLIKIMDTDLAWEIHDKLIDEYFAMRELKEKGKLSFEIDDPVERARVGLQEKIRERHGKLLMLKGQLELKRTNLITIENTLTFNEFDRASLKIVNKIAKVLAKSTREIWNDIYSFLSDAHGMKLKIRQKNEWKRLNKERMEKEGRKYKETTLQQKCSIKSTIKENEYEIVMNVIKAYAIDVGISDKEILELLRINK